MNFAWRFLPLVVVFGVFLPLMLCIRPFRPGRPGVEFGCGQCLACRINRRRMWTARLVLEAQSHGYPGTFLTLTYAPEHLPVGGTLVPGDLEAFRYRLRYRLGAYRYYFVGEYGERSGRAHYHGLVFGHALTRQQVAECWDGCDAEHVHVGTISVHSAAYMAGYVTKKMTKVDDPRLQGRHPEFARMSRKPGIGALGLSAILSWLWSEQGAEYVSATGDVPQGMRFDGKVYPLGRYLVGILRSAVGVEESNRMRSARQEARIQENAVPEVMFSREMKRENHYWRAKAYAKLKRSLEKV